MPQLSVKRQRLDLYKNFKFRLTWGISQLADAVGAGAFGMLGAGSRTRSQF